jgi:hypothetical protein
MMPKTLKTLALVIVKPICLLAWNRQYLRGRHFEQSTLGWRWAWRGFWLQKVLGFNRHVPWPCSPAIRILHPEGIEFDPDDLNNFQTFGCYYANTGGGRITIGKGTYIAPNVGIISANHDPRDPSRMLEPKAVTIGEHCWIGMNAVILPGVTLGSHTVVGAGSVVSTSFRRGYGVLVGVPARVSLTYPLPGPGSEQRDAEEAQGE